MNRQGAEPRSLLKHWPEVAETLRKRKRLILFLDFDGTLVPIASRPGGVHIGEALRRSLSRLTRKRKLTVAIISGRRSPELKSLVGVPRIHYMGVYGSDWGGRHTMTLDEKQDLEWAHLLLSGRLERWEGVWLEHKGRSLSVHLSAHNGYSKAGLRHFLTGPIAAAVPRLRILENKRDIELIPRSLGDKGDNVRRFIAGLRRRSAFSIYLGDDYSDESAFQAIGKGISVLVGEFRPSRAHYHLSSPAQVQEVLGRIGEAAD